MSQRAPAGYAVGGVLVVILELAAIASWQGWLTRQPLQSPAPFAAIAAPDPARAELIDSQQPPPRPEDRYYAHLREKVRWVETRLAGTVMLTPDVPSRMLLAKSAASRAGLAEVGLGFEDVYGIINAETSWVPRAGSSKDGTPNLGVAQFEPATAQALGLRNPDDVVEAVHVAARHMKDAAQWSAGRISGLKLDHRQRAAKLREGVSVYYNLSSRGRAAWNGNNTSKLPSETNSHIRNTRLGAREAVFLDAELEALGAPRFDTQPTVTADAGQVGR